jgi:hypothetical protein
MKKASASGDRVPRSQIHPHLPAEVVKRVRSFAASKGSSQSAIIEAALASYLDDSGERAVILRRLDRLARAIGTLDRDVTIVADALAVYVQLWLATTVRISDQERARAEQNAEKRFAVFKEHVSGRFSKGRSFIADLVREGRAAGLYGSNDAADGEGDGS